MNVGIWTEATQLHFWEHLFEFLVNCLCSAVAFPPHPTSLFKPPLTENINQSPLPPPPPPSPSFIQFNLHLVQLLISLIQTGQILKYKTNFMSNRQQMSAITI